jgi:hypothetical protein
VGVNGIHHVAGDERLPALVRTGAVRPLLVCERPGRPERHDEDHGPGFVKCNELVLDDAHPHRRQERARPSGLAVQEVQHRVVLARVGCVAGRQVHVDRLVAAPERRARDLEPDGRATLRDVGRVSGRGEPAVLPVVVEIAVNADQADACKDRCGEDDERASSVDGHAHSGHPYVLDPRCWPALAAR